MKRLIPFLFLAVVLQSCYSSRYCSTYVGNSYSDKNKSSERKIIYNAQVHVTTINLDTCAQQLKKIAESNEGYAQEIGSYSSTIRVKSNNLEKAIEEISTLGKVTSKNIEGNDVTEQYIDYNIQLENAEKSRERYLELLNQAVTVTEILGIEKELERLNGFINLLKGKINKVDHLSDYATITVYTTKKVKPGLLGYVGMGLWYPVKWLFVRN